MDTKIIVEKALKGEDLSTEINSLPEADQVTALVAVKTALKAEADKELARVSGLRQEGQRVEEKNKAKETEVVSRFALDQKEQAKNDFFSNPDFPMTEAQKAEIEAEFARRAPDTYSIPKLLNEYKRAYGAVMAESLIDTRKKAVENEKSAQEFMSGMAGGAQNISQADMDKYSPEAKKLLQDLHRQGFTNRTLADAQRLIDKGAGRFKNDLSN